MTRFSHSLAVVIGINHYSNGISLLQTAVDDAKEVARILEQEHKYDKVWLLLNEQASLQALQQLLDRDLIQHVQPDDRLLFYFGGHGIALNGEDGPEGFLIPQDAKLGDTKSYLSMPKLQAFLSELPCRHFLGILDCCFAGAFRWSSTRKLVVIEPGIIHKERFDRFIADPAWQVITSAAYDQTAMDSLSLDTERGQIGNHSPFAAALIEALSAGKADIYPPADAKRNQPAGDGVTTATDLYVYLRDRVEPVTEVIRQRQTPGIWPLKKHDKGEYIFLTPGHTLNLPPAPPLDESKNPYRGLQSFEEEQSHLFFGRQALTAKLCEFVSDRPLSVVLGASGSGKSSLVKAGLIPYVRQQETKAAQSQWQILAPMRPGEAPFKALSNTLTQVDVAGFFMPETGSALDGEMLTQYMAAWTQQHLEIKLMLAIDQFEELITLCRNEKEREQFLNGLVQVLTAYPEQLRLVLTLRSDFEPQFQDAVLKEYWSAARFVVPPMTRAELREVIEEPASKRVMYFQSDDPKNSLVDQLIDEVAEMPGALPLLSFTLSELYLKYLRRQKIAKDRGESIDRAITEADYKDLGGVARSLTQRADQEYKVLVQKDPAYEQTIRYVMLRMVTVGGGELARRRVSLSEFEYPPAQNDRVKEIIQHFSSARLLVEGKDPDGKPYAEPAHDALVRGWQKLLTWKQEEEENLILQRRLTPAAEEWKDISKKKQSKGFLTKAEPAIDWLDRGLYSAENLLNKAATQVVQLWKRSQQQQERSREKSGQFLWNTNPYLDVLNQQLQSNDNRFNQVESEFVKESVLQRRKNTSWRWRIATAVILGLSGLTIAALIGQRNAQIGQAKASRQAAEANLQTNQELDALINALRAGRTLQTLLPFGLFKSYNDLTLVRGTLSKAVQTKEISRLDLASIVRKENYTLKEIFYSQDERLIAVFAGGSQREAPFRFWDIETQQTLQNISDNSRVGLTKTESLSPDDKQNLGYSIEYLMNPNQSLLVGIDPGNGQGNSVYKVFDRKLKRDFIPEFSGYLPLTTGGGGSIVSNLDGSKLATVDTEGIVHVWQVGERIKSEEKLIEDIEANKAMPINEGKFSDSQDSETEEKLRRIKEKIIEDLTKNRGYTNDQAQDWLSDARVTFSGDRKKIFVLGQSGAHRSRVFYLWDLESQKEIKELKNSLPKSAHYEIESARFSPDDKLLAIADTGNLRLWDLKNNRLLDQPFQGDIACNQVGGVVFSPDNQLIATTDFSHYICLRNFSNYQLAKFETADHIRLNNFSVDSKILFATGYNSDNITQAWRIESFDELMMRGCSLVHNYLNAPDSNISESDRHICDDISIPKSNEAYSVTISSPQASPQSPTPTPTPEITDIAPLTSSPTFSISNKGEISFAPGKTSTQIDAEIQPQNIDKYTFGASKGQTVQITIDATEQVFIDVWQPNNNRLTIEKKAGSFSAVLPIDGTYTIDIINKKTSISSSYRLNLEIEP